MKDVLSLHNFLAVLGVLYLLGLSECAPNEDDAFTCKSDGKFSHQNPRKYHQCLFVGNNEFTHSVEDCPKHNCFKAVSQTCEFEEGECPKEVEGSMPSKSPSFNCPDNGKFPHPDRSRTNRYVQWKKLNGKFYYQDYQCPPTKPCFSPRKHECELRDPCH